MDLEDVMLREISRRRRTDTGRLCFCVVPRGGVRVTETGSRGWRPGTGGWGVSVHGDRVSVAEDENVLEMMVAAVARERGCSYCL